MVGGGCTYDYSASLSPNPWIMTFDLDLDLDLGLTIIFIQNQQNFHQDAFVIKSSLHSALRPRRQVYKKQANNS